jgi:hypothetical protein
MRSPTCLLEAVLRRLCKFFSGPRLDELIEKRCNHYRQIVACMLSGASGDRPVIVRWPTLRRADWVRNDRVRTHHAVPGCYATQTQFLWGPTITGRSRLAPFRRAPSHPSPSMIIALLAPDGIQHHLGQQLLVDRKSAFFLEALDAIELLEPLRVEKIMGREVLLLSARGTSRWERAPLHCA